MAQAVLRPHLPIPRTGFTMLVSLPSSKLSSVRAGESPLTAWGWDST